MLTSAINKYLHVLWLGVQINLAYRLNFLARAVFGLIPMAAIITVWKTIYGGDTYSTAIAGYTFAEMVTYYVLIATLNMLTAVHDDDWQIAKDIREGNINHFLVKPIDYLWFRFWTFIGGRIAYTSVAVWPLLLFTLILGKAFHPPANFLSFLVFIASTILSACLQFLISFATAMLAFWVLEVSTFIFIVFAFEFIASGQLFPLDLLPPTLRSLLMYSPFPYEMYFPVAIYSGKIPQSELVHSLLLQLGWVCAMYWIARFMLNRGIKHFSAYGG